VAKALNLTRIQARNMPRLLFNFDGLTLAAETLHTPTAAAIVAALPLEGRAQTWGDEVYFGIDVSVRPEKEVRPLIEAGETAYWPDGEAIAIGFGRTPISAPGRSGSRPHVIFGQKQSA